jgi:hypothetical protein
VPSDAHGPLPADVFVAFGVSGDLARKMTFVSLYQLERRNLLNCPIVGVAAESWTDDDLRRRASESVTAALGEAKPDQDVLDRLCRPEPGSPRMRVFVCRDARRPEQLHLRGLG